MQVMNSKLLNHISTTISDATHCSFTLQGTTPIGGGDINEAYRLEGTDGAQYFLKLNEERHLAMFASEAQGLTAIVATNTIRTPSAIVHGKANGRSFLVLEHLELNSHGNAKQLGEQLAALHRCTAQRFGFSQNNFIGTTAQPNAWTENWITFWSEQRLGHQLRLAERNGYDGRLQDLGARLLEALPAFFTAHSPQPSLLHGDLWSGNHAYLADGTPIIFDPATYYGDRECDLAMTELFGEYDSAFFTSYRAAYPLDRGYEDRRDLYNLYHVLNHANLFGGGYAGQAEQIMQRLLADIN